MDSAWLRIEMDDESKRMDRRPRPPLIPGTIRNSVVTGRQISHLEQSGGRFDAAYFIQQTICMFLWRFRSRVPYVVAMDGTPWWYAKHDLWYAQPHFDPKSLVFRAKHELTRRVYDQAFHLLPWSWSCRESLIDDYGIPPERITVVPPGVNLRTYIGPDREARTEGDWPLKLLFVGYDFIRKGGDLLVKLAHEREFRDVQFNFVTSTYQGEIADNIRVFDDVTANSPRAVGLLAGSRPLRAADTGRLALGRVSRGDGDGPAGDCDARRRRGGGGRGKGETGYLVPKRRLRGARRPHQASQADRTLRLRMGFAAGGESSRTSTARGSPSRSSTCLKGARLAGR